jgi:hypothetical protein
MPSVKATLSLEVDNSSYGGGPTVRRIECQQLDINDGKKLPPAPGTFAAFLSALITTKKVWMLRADQLVNIYAEDPLGYTPQLALKLNPGGFIILVDGDLGNLVIENPGANVATVEQLTAGGSD